MGEHVQTGLAGCFSIDEYDRDVIKKHERTRRDKEDDRTRHMIALRAQTGVVFLTYRADAAIDRLQTSSPPEPPLYHFTAADGVHHTIWTAGAEETNSLVDACRAIPTLYIADGHHRAASAARARPIWGRGEQRSRDLHCRRVSGQPAADPALQPHRQGPGRCDAGAVSRRVEAARRRSTEGGPVPESQGLVSMYLDGRWYASTSAR